MGKPSRPRHRAGPNAGAVLAGYRTRRLAAGSCRAFGSPVYYGAKHKVAKLFCAGLPDRSGVFGADLPVLTDQVGIRCLRLGDDQAIERVARPALPICRPHYLMERERAKAQSEVVLERGENF